MTKKIKRELAKRGFEVVGRRGSKHYLVEKKSVKLTCSASPKDMENMLREVERDWKRKQRGQYS